MSGSRFDAFTEEEVAFLSLAIANYFAAVVPKTDSPESKLRLVNIMDGLMRDVALRVGAEPIDPEAVAALRWHLRNEAEGR